MPKWVTRILVEVGRGGGGGGGGVAMCVVVCEIPSVVECSPPRKLTLYSASYNNRVGFVFDPHEIASCPSWQICLGLPRVPPHHIHLSAPEAGSLSCARPSP